jgi:hypothetical protein
VAATDNLIRWVKHLDARQKKLEALLAQLAAEVEELAGQREAALRRELQECGVPGEAIERLIARGTVELVPSTTTGG